MGHELWGRFDPGILQSPGGMVLFVLVYAAAEVLLLPAAPGTVLAGSVYGLPLGTALVMAGAWLGALTVFVLARHWLRPQASRWLAASPRLATVQELMQRQGMGVLLLARLSPVLPFNLLNVACGLSAMRPATFTLGLLGILPGALLYVGIGAGLRRGLQAGSGTPDPAVLVSWLGGGATLALAVLLLGRAWNRHP